MLHGFKSLTLVDEHGDPQPTYSIAAGLDYPSVGPEHSYLKTSNRGEYYTITSEEALTAFQELSQTEGIIPALESAHAVAYAMKMAESMSRDDIIVVNLSGRGDKDVAQVFQMLRG
ncbi:Tryptophan synthase [Lentibacillus sp. JNUCC-1]|nr:Tryptophan synthase [Lentibacillus sp. JNUCC-1]